MKILINPVKIVPRPGLRNIKTAIAIILCVLLYQYLDRNGVILAAIAALICMQNSLEKSVQEGKHRMIGTTLGGILGVFFVYCPFLKVNYFIWIFLVFVGIVLLIHYFNLFRIQDSIIIGVIVFLIIVLEAEGSGYVSPLLYAMNRILDTFIGIIFATGVNYFLFRPRPERITGQEVVDLEYRVIKAEKQKISDWSGGTTTELFIYPEKSFYGDRDFEWRISTAQTLSRSSTFTQLPGYVRWIMVLKGRMRLDHHDHHRITLDVFDQDYFDGRWVTKSYGHCTDFNLMLQEGRKGHVTPVESEIRRPFDPAAYTSFYILADSIRLVIEADGKQIVSEDLEKHDFIMFYPLEEPVPDSLIIYLQAREVGDVQEFSGIETVVLADLLTKI